MIHIVVGCDATGKSTLCEGLREKTGFPIIHMDKPKTQQEQEQMFEEYKTLFMSTNNVIMDRSFYCEMVYGPIFRGKSWISEEQARELERILATKGAIIYHCTDTPARIIERFLLTGESYARPEQVKLIVAGYNTILSKVGPLPVIPYTIREDDYE